MTLHAYSPPLNRVGTYEVLAADGALLRHPRAADVPLEAEVAGIGRRPDLTRRVRPR